MWVRRLMLATLLVLLSGAVAKAQAPIQERHSFESITLTGQLQIPASVEQRLPASTKRDIGAAGLVCVGIR